MLHFNCISLKHRSSDKKKIENVPNEEEMGNMMNVDLKCILKGS